MKYEIQQKIRRAVLNETAVTEDHVIRSMAKELISKMPIEAIKELMSIEVITHEYCMQKFKETCDEYWLRMDRRLNMDDLIIYKGYICTHTPK